MTDDTEPDDRQHVDDSDEYSQLFGIVIGHPPQCDLFQEVEGGYEIDATPNSELRELIDEWRDEYGDNEVLDKWDSAQDVQIRNCADELEALIDDDTQAGDGG